MQKKYKTNLLRTSAVICFVVLVTMVHVPTLHADGVCFAKKYIPDPYGTIATFDVSLCAKDADNCVFLSPVSNIQPYPAAFQNCAATYECKWYRSNFPSKAKCADAHRNKLARGRTGKPQNAPKVDPVNITRNPIKQKTHAG